jgi:hypothetical protein
MAQILAMIVAENNPKIEITTKLLILSRRVLSKKNPRFVVVSKI